MSYQTSLVRARVARYSPLSGELSDLLENLSRMWQGNNAPPTGEQQCWGSANKQVAALDAQRSDVNKNWNPTGFYTPAQITAIYNVVGQMVRNASGTYDKARQEAMAQGDRDALYMQYSDMLTRYSDGLKFIDASKQATSAGVTVIDAPGLKRWVVAMMGDASALLFGIYYVQCMRPWFVGALEAFMIAFNAVYSVVRATIGVAYEIVKAAGKAVLKVPDALGTAITVAKWGVLGGIAYVLYKKSQHQKVLGI